MGKLDGLRYQGNFENDLNRSVKSEKFDPRKWVDSTKTVDPTEKVDCTQSKNSDPEKILKKLDIEKIKKNLPDPRDPGARSKRKKSKAYELLKVDPSGGKSRDSVKISARVKAPYVEVIKKIPKSTSILQGRGGVGDQIGQLVEDWQFLRDYLKFIYEKLKNSLTHALDAESRAHAYLNEGGELELKYLKDFAQKRESLITSSKVLGLYDYVMLDKLKSYGIMSPGEYEDFIYLTRGERLNSVRDHGSH